MPEKPDNFVSEGLIEFLQATAPQWATKLTMERLAFVRLLSEAKRETDRLRMLLGGACAWLDGYQGLCAPDIANFLAGARAALGEEAPDA